MKPVALVLLMVVIVAALTACGDADSGADSIPTPKYAILSLDGGTPPADSAAEPEIAAEVSSTEEPDGGMTPSPEPANVTSPVTPETSTPTSAPEPTTPTATPVVTDHGEVSNGLWELALLTVEDLPLLTVEDLPPDREWTSQALEPMLTDQSVVCGVSDPTDSAAYQNASNGVLFFDPTAMVFIQQMITEYVTPEAARQMLVDTQLYFEALRTCDDPGEGAVEPPSDLERLQNMEITPIDLPDVGDDRIGYGMTFKSEIPQPQPALDAEIIAIRIDHVLVVIGSGNWEDELPPVDTALIERAVEKVELALAEPPVHAVPESPVTSTPIAALEVMSITTCEQAAEELVGQLQTALDIIAPLTLSDLSPAEAPPGIDEIGLYVEAIETRAHDLGCVDAEFGALVVSAMDQLTIDGPTAQLFADLFRAEYQEYSYDDSESES